MDAYLTSTVGMTVRFDFRGVPVTRVFQMVLRLPRRSRCGPGGSSGITGRIRGVAGAFKERQGRSIGFQGVSEGFRTFQECSERYRAFQRRYIRLQEHSRRVQ